LWIGSRRLVTAGPHDVASAAALLKPIIETAARKQPKDGTVCAAIATVLPEIVEHSRPFPTSRGQNLYDPKLGNQPQLRIHWCCLSGPDDLLCDIER
jgi:hypothetical protein